MNQPFPKTWWVEDGMFLAGCFPGSAEPGGTEAKLQLLVSIGIRTFISLQEEDERNLSGQRFPDYLPILAKLGDRSAVSLGFHRFAIRDMSVPAPSLGASALQAITASIKANLPLYLHCWGGHGRTATIVGLWLVRNGYTGEAALAEIKRLRSPYPELRHEPAPQFEPQCDLIRHWASLDPSMKGNPRAS